MTYATVCFADLQSNNSYCTEYSSLRSFRLTLQHWPFYEGLVSNCRILEHTEQMIKRRTCNSKKMQMKRSEFNNSIPPSACLWEIIHKQGNTFHRMKTNFQDNHSWYARKMMTIIITMKHSTWEVTLHVTINCSYRSTLTVHTLET